MVRSDELLSETKSSAEGSALRKSATTVATAASSLKHGTRTATRIDDNIIPGMPAESVRHSIIQAFTGCRKARLSPMVSRCGIKVANSNVQSESIAIGIV